MINLSDYQAFFSDIDGTLLDRKSKLHERTINAMRQLPMPLYLISGRSEKAMRGIQKELSAEDTLITLNGNAIMQNGKLLYQGPSLEGDILDEVLDRVFSLYADKVSINAYDPFFWYANNISDPHTIYEINVVGFAPDILFSSKDELRGRRLSKLMFIGEIEILAEIKKRLKGIQGIEAVYTHPDFLEVLPIGSNKRTGILKAAELLSIDLKKSIGAGDTEVDVPFLDEVGLPLLMGNSKEEIRKENYTLLDTNENDGLAKFIEEYL